MRKTKKSWLNIHAITEAKANIWFTTGVVILIIALFGGLVYWGPAIRGVLSRAAVIGFVPSSVTLFNARIGDVDPPPVNNSPCPNNAFYSTSQDSSDPFLFHYHICNKPPQSVGTTTDATIVEFKQTLGGWYGIHVEQFDPSSGTVAAGQTLDGTFMVSLGSNYNNSSSSLFETAVTVRFASGVTNEDRALNHIYATNTSCVHADPGLDNDHITVEPGGSFTAGYDVTVTVSNNDSTACGSSRFQANAFFEYGGHVVPNDGTLKLIGGGTIAAGGTASYSRPFAFSGAPNATASRILVDAVNLSGNYITTFCSTNNGASFVDCTHTTVSATPPPPSGGTCTRNTPTLTLNSTNNGFTLKNNDTAACNDSSSWSVTYGVNNTQYCTISSQISQIASLAVGATTSTIPFNINVTDPQCQYQIIANPSDNSSHDKDNHYVESPLTSVASSTRSTSTVYNFFRRIGCLFKGC